MCEPRHLRYSVTHTPPRTGDIFIIAPDRKNARKDFGVSQPIRLPPECHRYTYIGQYPHDFPVRHGKSLGKIAEGGSGFAIRTSELRNDRFRHLCVRPADVYRILQSFFIIKHLTIPLPRPRLCRPFPSVAVRRFVQCERSETHRIFVKCLLPGFIEMMKIFKSFRVVRVGVQVQ